MPRSRADLSFDVLRGEKPRLQPPVGLAGLEREIFISVVASVPASHFVAEDVHLLAAYASCIAQQRRAADELAGGSQDRHWIDMHTAAVRSMNTLAVRLRIGPKARDRNNNQRRQATTRVEVSAYDAYPDLVGENQDRLKSEPISARTFDDLRRLRRANEES